MASGFNHSKDLFQVQGPGFTETVSDIETAKKSFNDLKTRLIKRVLNGEEGFSIRLLYKLGGERHWHKEELFRIDDVAAFKKAMGHD